MLIRMIGDHKFAEMRVPLDCPDELLVAHVRRLREGLLKAELERQAEMKACGEMEDGAAA